MPDINFTACTELTRLISLNGKRVLLAEDEGLIAMMAEDMLTALGATIVGPAASVGRVQQLVEAEAIDLAVLDVNLRDEQIDPVVEQLIARNVPVVLATGYGSGLLIPLDVVVLEKPYTIEKLASAISRALGN